MTNPVTQTGTTQATTDTSGSSSGTTGTNQLGTADFLQLLVGQLQNQDPLQPTDDSSWIEEMAQFSEVQEVTSMTQSNSQILSALNTNQALGLIGHQVTYTDENGDAEQGTVSAVDLSSGSPTLTINGQSGISAGSVTEVQ